MAAWGVPAPVAFRAGAYRYSAGIVQALPDFGMTYSFDYNLQGPSQQDSTIGPLPMFSWENGVVEVPISFVNGGTDRFDDYNYLNGSLADTYCAIAGFERTYGRTDVLTVMMHSWSLLYEIEPFDTFVYLDDDRTQQFADFLAHLPPTVRVVTARDLDALIASGELTVSLDETTADIFGD
jgi:hypothetical protein